MQILPPKEGTCPICAVDHEPNMPHNQQSLYYQYRFNTIRGRWPAWADAIAHCDDEVRAYWKEKLVELGHWSEPENGDPIADPPEESFRQVVGDNSE